MTTMLNVCCKSPVQAVKCGLDAVVDLAPQLVTSYRCASDALPAVVVHVTYLYLTTGSASHGHSVGVSDVVLSFTILLSE